MRRTLLVTNDFPPRHGGIQTYLHALTSRLPPDQLVVLASVRRGDPDGHGEFDRQREFPVVRHPGPIVGQPSAVRRARELVRSYGCDTVWFGAAAPLALTAPRLREAGAERVVASTHGHEVGWSMAPGTRGALRAIGSRVDVLTYVSRYSRSRFSGAFGPMAALEYLPCGVDPERFRPDFAARTAIRRRYGLGERPLVVCVSRLVPRKGQDVLVRALPMVRERVPGAALLLVGDGRYADRLRALARRAGVAEHVVFTGAVPSEELPAHYAAGDVFAMPCRTRGAGLDVEGFGIVYLEASASGLPVIAGDAGGAPETVRDGVTGRVVDGRSVRRVAGTVSEVLADPGAGDRMGAAGRDWVRQRWTWDVHAATLLRLLHGTGTKCPR